MSTSTPDQDPTTGYDPEQDQDSDPDSLAPRTGAQASGEIPSDADDPDADPAMLNPREGEQATSTE